MVIRRFNPFSKGISLELIVIVRLEFDQTYFEAAVQYFSNYATRS